MTFFNFTSVQAKNQLEMVMDAVVAGVVNKEVNKVMEEDNKKQVKDFNEGLVKVYLCKVKKIKMEVVMDVVVDEVVDKKVTKVVEQVNKELVKEVNECFVLVDVVMWCWTRKLTWRSTRRVTRKWPMLSTSFLTSEQFEGPYGNYKLEKGILHVNYVLRRFLVETT